jgi:Domain of unknown function (DUF1963)
MLDKEELRQRVIELGLEKYWTSLEKLVRQAIYMDTSGSYDRYVAIGTSKSGGAPDVPADFVWPHDAYGPRHFLMQINLSEMSSFDADNLLPKSGLLLFFTDSNGTGGEGIPGGDPVYYFPDITVLQRSNFPENYELDADDCLILSFYAGWSLPDTEEKFDFQWDTSNNNQEDMIYGVLRGLSFGDIVPLPMPDAKKSPNLLGSHYNNHLLGHPDDYQGALEPQAEMAYRGHPYPHTGTEEEKQAYSRLYDEISLSSFQDWICLLHDGDYCGGVFTLDYLIRRDDLARADFSKTVAFAVN